ncbi:hypothetical protein QBC37DRAFT_85921 [Rhypophila decipiens]|uniref:Uncharacterized protein n=1 Tax=Rhypophila decipiens TaxID=261697 RepID=A0AAN6XWG6_9PEZI|nr:hypothetical protein QBC37DRAFT_85921 [Rhypophila decipiens]
MDPPGLGIYRRRTLTNSAAEFVETRVGMDTVAQIVDSDYMDELQAVSEFVPELDQFVPKGIVIDVTKCYDESQKRMVKFQHTLHSFVRLLRERNVDNELNVEIKDPEDLTMADALDIIGKIQEGRNSKQVKSCKDFIHKCYRKAESKRAVAEAVLSMIPNDAYGSVISGGFTLILAAVEKHAEHRKAMQTFLAEIPDQLERIHRLSQLHLNSLRVHAQRDAVLVAIFVVLERIVDHLTQSWRGKVKNKVKVIFGNSKSKSSTDLVAVTGSATPDPSESKQTVTEALEDLRAQVDLFQHEVEMANSERLGRVENTSAFVKEGIVAIAKELRESRVELEQNRTWIEKFMTGSHAAAAHNRAIENRRASEERSQKELMHLLFTTLYQFHASNPAFDPKTGQLNFEEVAREERRRLQETARDTAPAAPPSFQKSNKEIFTDWLDRLMTKTGLPTHDFLEDAALILTSKSKLDHDQIDQCNYIMWTAPEYKTWLQINASSQNSGCQLLNINPQSTTGNQSINSLSFTTARTAITLRMQQSHFHQNQLQSHSPNWPVLAFFCRQRTMTSRNVDISGPPALIRSLCAQLTEWIVLFRPNIELARIKDLFRGAMKKLPNLNALTSLRALLLLLKEHEILEYQKMVAQCLNQGREPARSRLPQPLTIWILIDGLSYISIGSGGSTADSHGMVSDLWNVISDVTRPRTNQKGERVWPGVMVKLLVTDAFGNSPLRRITGPEVSNIHVPGQPTVAGGTRGVLNGGIQMKGDIGALVKSYLDTSANTENRDFDKNITEEGKKKEKSSNSTGSKQRARKGSQKSRSKGKGKGASRGESDSDTDRSESEEKDNDYDDGGDQEARGEKNRSASRLDTSTKDVKKSKKHSARKEGAGKAKRSNVETESESGIESEAGEESAAFSSDFEKDLDNDTTKRSGKKKLKGAKSNTRKGGKFRGHTALGVGTGSDPNSDGA